VEFKLDREGTIILLSVQGAIDLVGAPQLRARLDQLLSHSTPKLIVDLAGVPYIDSYGLGILMAAVKSARKAGGDIKLCALRPDVRTIFDVTGLSKHVSITLSRVLALGTWADDRSKSAP
jgi:anti-sigma B factor antagonist